MEKRDNFFDIANSDALGKMKIEDDKKFRMFQGKKDQKLIIQVRKSTEADCNGNCQKKKKGFMKKRNKILIQIILLDQ